jgi:hypothetical protein
MIFSYINLFPQEKDPYAIIDTMKYYVEQVIDYSADLEIDVDVDFINMPSKHARIYYKKPDKIKIKSDEFFMFPKRGLKNRMTEILDEPYTAIYLDQEIIREELHHVIRVVPMGRKPDIILATWWINCNSFLISRSESNTRNDGSFLVDLFYDDPEIHLPTEMIFTFEIEKLKLPLKFIGKSAGMEMDKSKMNDSQKGKVYIKFSNYHVNTDLQDELFEDNEGD